jgi:large subunit ribosomal protein L30
MTNLKIAIVLVRGLVNVKTEVKDTLAMLRLKRKNHCVVVDDNPVNRGMIKKVKDYITWGEISDEVYSKLVAQRGEEFLSREQDGKKKYTFKFLEVDGKKYKLYFRLNPPRKGFGRKGIKMPFSKGGALGNRAEKINDLIERML